MPGLKPEPPTGLNRNGRPDKTRILNRIHRNTQNKTFFLNLAFVWFFFLLKRSPIYAYDSLFFTEKEKAITPETFLDRHTKILKLSGILYISEEIWSLWLNNEIICPQNIHKIKEYHVERVTPCDVTFSWAPSNSSSRKVFTLRPYQTYSSKEQKVIDGLKN